MKNKKIAFVRPAAYPLPNKILPGVLGKVFPEYYIDVIDIKAILKAQPMILALNMLAMTFEYGTKLAAKHMRRGEAFYTTSYLNTKIGKLVSERIKSDEYAFTFQIQSLFDASTDLVPHFVYTDHTHLARLNYPGFNQRKLRSKKWIQMERGIYKHAALTFTRSSNISKSLVEQYNMGASLKIDLSGQR